MFKFLLMMTTDRNHSIAIISMMSQGIDNLDLIQHP